MGGGGRNSKFGVWMHLGMEGCRIQFLGHCYLHVPSIFPILFELGIPNLVCGCILGW